MTRSFTQRALSMVASVSDGFPPIQVEDFRPINKESFALILSSSPTSRNYRQEDYHNALASITGEKLGIVSDSLFAVRANSTNRTFYRCIAASNREVIPYNEQEMKKRGMHTTIANVIEDNNGHIWRVVSNGDNKQIVQVTEDNHVELLAKRRQCSQMTASIEDDFNIQFGDADYVYFFNPKIEAMDFGFAVATNKDLHVMSRSLKDTVKIEPHQVVEACSTDGYGVNFKQKRRELTAAKGGVITEWLNYLRSYYGKNSEYVKSWEKAVKNSAIA